MTGTGTLRIPTLLLLARLDVDDAEEQRRAEVRHEAHHVVGVQIDI